ncbi:MAG: BMP family ABC transporter substrate-binding protein [Anaerolineales bacterium]|nr:BMP family ABC transporter substrate-binding protein [Anaerolineae bacterium]PWB52245.1 MAG: BMP family ABC transporter substrate-binding protein [Anaerolineales bacterium]
MNGLFSNLRSVKKYWRASSLIVISGVALLIVTGLLFSLHTISAKAANTKVGMIILGSITNNGFNWLSYQGLVRAETEFSVIGNLYIANNEGEIELKTTQCVADDNDLCIGVGFLTQEEISAAAAAYPTTYFAIVDAASSIYPTNLRSLLFASEEVGYLAGTLAGRMSQSDTIGALGGWEIPSVTPFIEGYENGALCTNPEITTIISYTNDFYNPKLGSEYAQGMIGRGADVIFAVAGPTGDGAILTTTQSGVWAIGVDTDEYYTLFMTGTVEGAEYLLNSAMKRTDNAVFLTISDVVSGTFTSGSVIYNLESGGVGLAPFHEADPAVPTETKIWLNLISQAIISGVIHPLEKDSPCLVMNQLYLPLARR